MASLKTLSVMRHRHLCPCLSTMPKAIPSNSTSNPSFKRDKGISCSSGSAVHYNRTRRHHDLRRDMFLRVVPEEGQDVPPEGLSAAGEGAAFTDIAFEPVSSNRRLRCRRCVGLHPKCRQFLPVLAPSGTDMLGVFGDSDGDTPVSSSKTCPLSHCWRLTLRRPTSRRL